MLLMIGTKQGSVISPFVICLYLDGLQVKIAAEKCGCFFGNLFAGILAYADDIALLALTTHDMHRMLKLL